MLLAKQGCFVVGQEPSFPKQSRNHPLCSQLSRTVKGENGPHEEVPKNDIPSQEHKVRPFEGGGA